MLTAHELKHISRTFVTPNTLMTYQRAVLLKAPVLEYSFTLMTQIYKVIHNRSDEQKLQSVMNLIFLNWSDEWLPFRELCVSV